MDDIEALEKGILDLPEATTWTRWRGLRMTFENDEQAYSSSRRIIFFVGFTAGRELLKLLLLQTIPDIPPAATRRGVSHGCGATSNMETSAAR